MKKQYGVPYQGSKSAIAEKIVAILPAADVFYDLFAGGCAITHCAMLSGKYKHFVLNDISPYGIKLFLDALQGKYKDEKRWVSREDFSFYKDSDSFVRLCWSFGNNQRHYLYSTKIEPYKKAVHNLIFSNNIKERIENFRAIIRKMLELERNEKLYSINHFQNTQDINSLLRLKQIQEDYNSDIDISGSCIDYKDVVTQNKNAIIYCDIPYIGKTGYEKKRITNFMHDVFYTWAENQSIPCYISEYTMPKERFVEILSIDKTSSMNSGGTHTVEKLFVPKVQVEKGIVTLPPQIAQGKLL